METATSPANAMHHARKVRGRAIKFAVGRRHYSFCQWKPSQIKLTFHPRSGEPRHIASDSRDAYLFGALEGHITK